MAKRKAKPDADAQTPEGTGLSAPALPATEDDPAPQYLEAGSVSLAWVRWAYRTVNRLMMDIAIGVRECPKGFNPAQWRDSLDSLAKISGWDPRHLQDTRTDAQIYADATKELLESPDSIYEKTDEVMEAIEEQVERAHVTCAEKVGAPRSEAWLENRERERDADPGWYLKKKQARWLDRIRLVRKLAAWAKHAIPPNRPTDQGIVWKICHPLRYMLWVGRPGGDRPTFIICDHHVDAALKYYEARNSIVYQFGRWIPTPCEGIMYVFPPGHGKSAMATHFISLWISQNNRLRCGFGHAQAEKASENLDAVHANFDPDKAAGRRNLALFPTIKVERKNSKLLRLELKERQTAPTIMASGMTGQISGRDMDIIWFDDPCDQKLSEQDTERVRIWDRMNGTWRTRKRDGIRFEIITTTLWHHDDPNCRQLQLIKDNKIAFLAMVRSCGGPEQNFKPLAPEIYNATALKEKYNQMRNPRLYAAAYQSNPQPHELRKIKKLAYYLPGTEQHREFLAASTRHVSLDPTATNREGSDRASFVYAALGDVMEHGEDMFSAKSRLRMLDGRQFHANQTEGVEEVCAFAEANRVDYMHAETRSGFNATAEMLDSRGIDVIRHDPKNRGKELRLMDVAPMLDDSLRDKGFDGAVVEFPGRLVDGVVVQDPESPLIWLENQILDFGIATEDHGVDAVTQLCKYLGPRLGVGQGAVTMAVQREAAPRNPRLAKVLDRILGRDQDAGTGPNELAKWTSENL